MLSVCVVFVWLLIEVLVLSLLYHVENRLASNGRINNFHLAQYDAPEMIFIILHKSMLSRIFFEIERLPFRVASR